MPFASRRILSSTHSAYILGNYSSQIPNSGNNVPPSRETILYLSLQRVNMKKHLPGPEEGTHDLVVKQAAPPTPPSFFTVCLPLLRPSPSTSPPCDLQEGVMAAEHWRICRKWNFVVQCSLWEREWCTGGCWGWVGMWGGVWVERDILFSHPPSVPAPES